jgi:phenylalanyl-tRNA synthetase alpha chain
MAEIVINDPKEKALRAELDKRTDAEAARMRRYLAMPDLSRTPGNPLREIVERVIASPVFKGFDVIKVPEIVSTDITFDLFDFPKDHPARSGSDSYFVDKDHILRTHTTIMWYYYLKDENVKKRMAAGEAVGAFSFGKVYRKDEIDRHHLNVFHQIDGWYLAPKDKKIITIEDLKEALLGFGNAVFGSDVKVRFNEDTFPYTDPSLEMEMDKDGQWLETGGAGVVKGSVLEKFGIDSSKWNGWAFGPGLERFAMISMELPDIRLLWSQDERVKKQLKLGNKFKEVSKYPPITRDISFVVNDDFVPNNYFDLIHDIAGDNVEEVSLLDEYENAEKFGVGKISYTYRIVYRSNERTLTTEEIEPLQDKIVEETKKQFGGEIR